MVAGKGFSTAQYDAVYYDQRNEYAQGCVQGRYISLHQHLQQGYQGSDNDDVAGDMNLIRNQFPDGGNDDVGEKQNEGEGTAHTDGVVQGVTGGQRRTNTHQLDEQGVFLDDAFSQLMQHTNQSFPLA